MDSAALAGSWAEAPGIELLVSDGWSAPALPGVVCAETGVRVLVGTPDDPRIASLMERLPVEELPDERARAGRLVVEDMELLWRETVVVASLADPERPASPLMLAVSRHEARAAEALRRSLLAPEPWRPRMRVFEKGELLLEMRLTPAGRPRRETLDRRASVPPGESFEGPDGWLWFPPLGQAETRARSGQLRAALAGLEWAGIEPPEGLRIIMAPTTDRLGLLGPALRGARYDAVERRLTWGLPADGPVVLAEGLLRTHLGVPATGWWLGAAALEAALPGDLLLVACGLARGEEVPALEDVLSDSIPTLSPLALEPFRALAWRLLREANGPEACRAIWGGASYESPDPGAYEAALERVRELVGVQGTDGGDVEEPSGRSNSFAGAQVELPLDPHRGPGSRAAFDALVRARELGATLAMIRVHVVMPVPGRPSSVLQGEAGIRWAVQHARALDLETALLIDVLASPTGPADGERVLTSRTEWAAHFDGMDAAVEHASLLAELSGADHLVLSAGSPEALRSKIEDGLGDMARETREERAVRWRALAARASRIFEGDLLLHASRVDEVTVLDAFDGLLVELLPAGTPELPEGNRRLERALVNRIERAVSAHPRTYLDVGFRAREGARSSASGPGHGVSVELQLELMEALGQALGQEGGSEGGSERGAAPRPAGVWLRGFGALPGEEDPRGYGLDGRPAAEALGRVWR